MRRWLLALLITAVALIGVAAQATATRTTALAPSILGYNAPDIARVAVRSLAAAEVARDQVGCSRDRAVTPAVGVLGTPMTASTLSNATEAVSDVVSGYEAADRARWWFRGA